MQKEEQVNWGYGTVYLSFVNAEELAQMGQVTPTTSHCFPLKGNDVLFTVNPRGLDIIGGHVEKGETGEEAFMREAMEEGCIVPKSYALVGAIRVDNRDYAELAKSKGYPIVGYQLIYAVTDYEEQAFVATHECVAREYVPVNEVKSRHHAWLGVHEQALQEALKYAPQKKNHNKP